MLELLTTVILSIMAIASPTLPYDYHSYIAKASSLNEAVLAVQKIPETTETEPALIIALDEKEKDEEEGKGSPSEATALIPEVLRRISVCESGDRHFDKNGQVLRGRENPNDIGRWQINLIYHLETSQKMGLDIFKEEDNEKYALYLYKKNNVKDWLASEKCWKNI